MKRIISIFIVLTIIAGNLVTYAENNDSAWKISTYAVDAVKWTGAIDEYYDEDRIISRGEFVEMIIKLCNMEEQVDNKTEPLFYDVSPTNEYYGYIMLAARNGIVKGDDLRNFYPSKDITRSEALTISARTLGITEELSGIININNVISEEHLSRNVLNSDTLSFGCAVQLLFNIFNANYYYVDQESSYKQFKKINKDKKFYELYYNVGEISGYQITANQYTAINNENGTAEGCVIINNEQYQCGNTDASSLLGCKVNAYFVDSDDEKTIISIEDRNEENTIKISADDISDETTIRNIAYYENGKKKKINISAADVIYNAVYCKEYTDEDLKIDTGYITLISSENNSVYDVVKVDTYKNMFVSGIDANERIIYDKNSGDSITLKEHQYQIYGVTGTEMEMSSIVQKSVISVYESKNTDSNKFVRIIVSNKEPVLGTISSISNGDNGKKDIEINGSHYTVLKSLIDFHEKYPGKVPEIKTGMTAEFYLDAYGIIAAVVDRETGLKYGYLTSLYNDESDEDIMFFKIYSQDGAFIRCKSRKKIKINGETKNAVELMKSALIYNSDKKKVVDQIVRYQLDDNGDLRELEYAAQKNVVPHLSNATTLVHNETLTGNVVFRSYNKLGGKYIVGEDTVIFTVPLDINQEKGFGIRKSFPNDTYLSTTEIYNCSQAYKVGAIISRESNTPEYTDDMYLNTIKEIATALNSDNEVTQLVEYYTGGKLRQAYVADDEVLDGIERGDIVQFAYNNAGEIKGCKPIFKVCDKPNNPVEWCIYKNQYEYKSPGTNNPNDKGYSPLVTVYGICLAKDDNVITVTGFDEAGSVYATRTDGNVYIYDTSTRTIETTNFDSVVESASIDELTGSVVLTNARNDLGRELYIIK